MSYLNYNAIERRVSRRLLRYKRLFVHLVATVAAIVGITLVADRAQTPGYIQDILVPALVLLFVAHALWLMYCEVANFVLQQETAREQAQRESGLDEKPKNDRQIILGDDGEIVESPSDQSYSEKSKRG